MLMVTMMVTVVEAVVATVVSDGCHFDGDGGGGNGSGGVSWQMVVVVSLMAVVVPMMVMVVVADSDGGGGGLVVTARSILMWLNETYPGANTKKRYERGALCHHVPPSPLLASTKCEHSVLSWGPL